MSEIRRRQSEQIIIILLLTFLAVILSVIVTQFGAGNEDGAVHTVLEIINIIINFSIFVLMWNTYERQSAVNRNVGLFFLNIGIFNIAHLLVTIYIRNFHLAGFYQNFETFLGAFAIFTVVTNKSLFKLNKWFGLLLTGLISSIVIAVIGVFYSNNDSVLEAMLDYMALFLLFYELYILQKNKKHNNFNLLFYTVIFAVMSQVVGMLPEKLSFDLDILGAFFELFYYFSIFSIFFKSSVTYPYEKLEETNKTLEAVSNKLQDTTNYMIEIFNSLYTGLVTYTDDFELAFANEEAQRVLGYTEEELVGLKVSTITDMFVEDQTKKNELKQIPKNPDAFKIINIKNKNGERFQIRGEYLKLKTSGYIHVFHDAKKEQQLENLRLQTRTILDSIQSSVILMDNECKILMCNRFHSNMVEMDFNDIIGQNILEYKKRLGYQEIRKIEQDGNEEGTEATFISAGGRKRHIIINSGPIENYEGDKLGTIEIAYDLTEYNKEHEKMKQQEKLAVLGQMAAGVVHEIRNPLTSIKGLAQVLKADMQNALHKEIACTIETEANGVNKVVSDFLVFAQPRRPVLKNVSVNELVRSIYLVVETSAYLKSIEVKMELDLDEKDIRADEGQLKQVIFDIVNNAMDAMDKTEKPVLTIATACNLNKEVMEIIISDNGIGMTEEDKVKVATPFYTTKDNGTGLGLSICYQIIKEHGGRIEFASDYGVGTTFTLSLPFNIGA